VDETRSLVDFPQRFPPNRKPKPGAMFLAQTGECTPMDEQDDSGADFLHAAGE
jgi:hypothetical protein